MPQRDPAVDTATARNLIFNAAAGSNDDAADERVETTLRVLPLMPAPDATDAVPRPVPRGRGRPRPRVDAVQWRIGPL